MHAMNQTKDTYLIISRAKKLDQVRDALGSSGYMNDDTRRTLMAAVDRSPLPKSARKDAFCAVMGPVSAMQNSSRCLDWWERLVKSPEMTTVALEHGMPYAALLADFDSRNVLRNALEDKHYASALLLWSKGHTHAQRVEAIDEVIEMVASYNMDNEQAWIEPTVSAVKGKASADQLRLVAHFFCEGWFFDKKDQRMGALWATAFFPEGMPRERFEILQSHIKANARGISEAAEYAEGVLRALVSVHDQKLLDETTQAPAKATPARRI